MNPFNNIHKPSQLNQIETATKHLGFDMASEPKTGAFLRTLAASKPKGRFLELGTGTGFGTAWILDGMDTHATLLTLDNDPEATAIAQQYLGQDPRLSIEVIDIAKRFATLPQKSFDFIFADAWMGKFDMLDHTIALLAPGGFLVLDDLLPQPNWPENHAPRIPALLTQLKNHPELVITPIEWASGLILASKK